MRELRRMSDHAVVRFPVAYLDPPESQREEQVRQILEVSVRSGFGRDEDHARTLEQIRKGTAVTCF